MPYMDPIGYRTIHIHMHGSYELILALPFVGARCNPVKDKFPKPAFHREDHVEQFQRTGTKRCMLMCVCLIFK